MSATGQIVYLGQMDVAHTAVEFVLASTVLGAGGTTLAFTVYQGITQAASATTAWVVPNGKTLRIVANQLGISVSTVTGSVRVQGGVLVSTALPTYTSAVAIFAPVNAIAISAALGPVSFQQFGLALDIPAGATVGIGVSVSITSATIQGMVVVGYLFP